MRVLENIRIDLTDEEAQRIMDEILGKEPPLKLGELRQQLEEILNERRTT